MNLAGKVFLILLFTPFILTAQEDNCKFGRPFFLNFVSSPEREMGFEHDKNGRKTTTPVFINSCNKGNFLMIRSAVKTLRQSAGAWEVDYGDRNEEGPDLFCRIKNKPQNYLLDTRERRDQHQEEDRLILDTCLIKNIKIIGRELTYPEEQEFCK